MDNYKWYDKLQKSQLTPPNYIFSIVWPILYVLMFISLFKILQTKQCSLYCTPLIFFFLQLILNLSWTTIFFRYKLIKTALLVLTSILILTIITFIKFKKISIIASYLLVPYIIWLFFAFYLNFYIVINN